MIFANNKLTLTLLKENDQSKCILQFDSFDALSFVEIGRLPNIKVIKTNSFYYVNKFRLSQVKYGKKLVKIFK